MSTSDLPPASPARVGRSLSTRSRLLAGLAAVVLWAPVWSQTRTLQEWVGYWELGERRVVITAPQDGAADAILIRAYPQGLRPTAGDGGVHQITLQGFSNDPEHPVETDAPPNEALRLRMRLSGSQLRIEQEPTSRAAADLSGVYRRNTRALPTLWAEKPQWLQFHCDCPVDRIREEVMRQLDRGYAVGRDFIPPQPEHLVMDTLDETSRSVLVVSHSADSACSEDSLRIVSRGPDGRWRGEVARWLGLQARPGGVRDRDLWQLTTAEQQRLASLESADARAIPTFGWDHGARTLTVGMQTCIVLPDEASPRQQRQAEQLEALAQAFKPRRYRVTGTPAPAR